MSSVSIPAGSSMSKTQRICTTDESLKFTFYFILMIYRRECYGVNG